MKNIVIFVIGFILNISILFSQFMDATRIYEKCSDAVVLIKTPYGTGSGFFINENGYIITNHHVIQDYKYKTVSKNKITIQTKKGRTYNVVSVDDTPDFDGLDIAILKISLTNNDYLPITKNEVLVGEDVVAIGHPNNDLWNQSKGIISKTSLQDKYLIQHDVPTDEGNSGGPLINSKGQVVGVVTAYKRMLDNNGQVKVQETGKLATNSIWIKNVLNKRKIKYYEDVTIFEGASEYERQFNQLQKDRESLEKDREDIRQGWEKLNNDKQKLTNDKIEFERKVKESNNIIERADLIKQEFDNTKEIQDKRWKDIIDREKEVAAKESKLKNKEIEINKKLSNRLSFELSTASNYLYNENNDMNYLNMNASVGLFLRFGIVRTNYGEDISSERIGVVYSLNKYYNFNKFQANDIYNHDLSIAIEFSDILRLGIGKNLINEFNYFGFKEYNFAYMNINTTGYPYAFGFNFAYYTDNNFDLNNYEIGIFFRIGLNFLRL